MQRKRNQANGNCKEIITVLGREDGKQFDGESFFDEHFVLSLP